MFPAHRKHPRRELLRALVVAVTALAWLFPSVRCAMGCGVPLGAALPACCAPTAPPGAAPALAPASDDDRGADSCREVRAEFSREDFARSMFVPAIRACWGLAALLAAPPPRAALIAPSAAPPASSFAERVLQESLFAHAPPHSR